MILGITASSVDKGVITNYVFDQSTNAYFIDEAVTPSLLDGVIEQTWVIRCKVTGANSNRTLIGNDQTVTELKMEIDGDDNQCDIALDDSGSGRSSMINGGITGLGAWHLYSFTYDTTNGLELFTDGTSIKTDADILFTTRTAGMALYIGALAGEINLFHGEISDVQLYSRVLTSTELGDLATDITDLPTDHATYLVANFATDKTSTVWTDDVSGFELTNQGGVTTN